jgi:hypothetical protein
MTSDEAIGRQILCIFVKHKVVAGSALRRNHFIAVEMPIFNEG